MLRSAVPAFLLGGLLLAPSRPVAATPLCYSVTVTVGGTSLPLGPVCVPFDGVAICGEKLVTITRDPVIVAVLVTYCVPST
jgi:hypothetical protein